MFWRLKTTVKDYYAKAYCQLNTPNKASVVLYHGIDQFSNKNYNYRFFSCKEFALQLKYLKSKYRIVPLRNLFNEPNNKKLCAITFDDRYENWLSLALPIIQKEHVPVTFCTSSNSSGLNFIWTDFFDIASKECNTNISLDRMSFNKNNNGSYINSDNIYLKDYLKSKSFEYKLETIYQFKKAGFELEKHDPIYWRVLTDKQISTISKNKLVEIGSHSDNHNNLSKISAIEAEEELRYSKETLEKVIEKEIISIAYPDGDYNRQIISTAEEIGYKHQLACNYLFPEDISDKRILNRLGLYTHQSTYQQFKENIF